MNYTKGTCVGMLACLIRSNTYIWSRSHSVQIDKNQNTYRIGLGPRPYTSGLGLRQHTDGVAADLMWRPAQTEGSSAPDGTAAHAHAHPVPLNVPKEVQPRPPHEGQVPRPQHTHQLSEECCFLWLLRVPIVVVQSIKKFQRQGVIVTAYNVQDLHIT